jgi:hypothetical protein
VLIVGAVIASAVIVGGCHHSHAQSDVDGGTDSAVDAAPDATQDPCIPVVPTCADGTPAAVFDAFSADGQCTRSFDFAGQEFAGSGWSVFQGPTGVIVHVTSATVGPNYGEVSVGVVGQFGELGASGCGGSEDGELCDPQGSPTSAWLRWTIMGVDANGPIVSLATSDDASTWRVIGATDNIGEIFSLEASADCFLSQPPHPCPGLGLTLSDAVFTCTASP